MINKLNINYIKIKFLLLGLGLATFMLLQFAFAPKANATTYNVTTSSACSLVDALISATSDTATGSCLAGEATPDTINVAAGTYTITADIGFLTNSGDLTVVGDNPITTIINGAGFTGATFASAPGTNVSVSNLTFTGFVDSGTAGPAVLSVGSGNLTVNNIVVHGNTCTTIPICSILANYAPSGTTGTISVSNSAFYNNTSFYIVWVTNLNPFVDPIVVGGSVQATFTNNTFSGNTGAAIGVNNGSDSDSVSVDITNNTIANSTFTLPPGATPDLGGAIMIVPQAEEIALFPAEIKLLNNVFSNNLASGNPINCQITIPTNGGTITSQGGNVSSDNTCSSYFTNTNDLNNTDPQLQALVQDNSTFVRPIGNTSPAYNNAVATGAPTTDQRGVARPQNGAYDSGAYEYVGPAPSGGSGGGTLAGTGWDTKLPALVAGLLVLGGILATGYAIKKS